MTTPLRPLRRALLALVLALAATACGDDDSAGRAETDGDTGRSDVTLRLLTHESFAVSDGVLDAFTEETGIRVRLLRGGDAGTVVNQAILAKGNPQADVLFGIDSTFLSRALAEDLFVAHEAEGLDEVDEELLLDDEHRVTPITYGDVCVNYDKEWFAEADLAVPESLDDLLDPAYRDLLVVQNPATSSPGLAFLLATVAEYGEDGWQDWWRQLRGNGVTVTSGWSDAYYGEFSGGAASEGQRPLVVSYASSPPVEVIFADPPVDEAPTGVVTAGCYRQIEAAGILDGTDHEDEAALLVDFLLSETFQADVAPSMFVYPVLPGVELPEAFVANAATPDDVAALDPELIDERREAWIDEWTDLVLR